MTEVIDGIPQPVDQTGAEIKALYEAEADTNAFDDAAVAAVAAPDAQKIKGVTVDDSAKADQKVLAYVASSENIEYITQAPSGAAIASIQSGTVTIASGSHTGTAAINSVDTTKSALFHIGRDHNPAAAVYHNYCHIDLTNATTITATRIDIGGNAGIITVNFVLVEFSSGIESIQRGIVTQSNAKSNTATITSVDVAKSWISHLGIKANSAVSLHEQFCSTLELTNATTVTAETFSNSGQAITKFQVVEFS